MSGSPSSSRRTLLLAAGSLGLVVTSVAIYLFLRTSPPGPGTPVYEEYVDAFQIAVGALDADVPQIAEEQLSRAVELIPQEPSGWANRGLLNLRMNRLPEAALDLGRAQQLAPQESKIQKLLGLLEQRRGNFGRAAEHLRRAFERDRHDIKSLYLLTQVIDQEHKPDSDAESQRFLEQILKERPDNPRVLLDHLKVALRRSDEPAMARTMKRLQDQSLEWSERGRKYLHELESTLAGADSSAKVRALLQFSNVLKGESGFPRSVLEVSSPEALVGDPIQAFLWLPPVRHSPAPPLVDSTFLRATPRELREEPCLAVLPVWLISETAPTVFVADESGIRALDRELTLPAFPVRADGIVAIDWNNDTRTDVLLIGAEGLRFYEQQSDGQFVELPGNGGLEDDVLHGDYRTGTAADIDLDGDLDVLISRKEGTPLFLRNNFDGTFSPLPIFADVEGPQQFAWGDFDQDGVGDAVLLDSAGKLLVFFNDRSAQFTKATLPRDAGKCLAISVADGDDDGALDVIALRRDGILVALSAQAGRAAWRVKSIARQSAAAAKREPATVRILTADFDNNGAIDVLISDPKRSELWLGSGHGTYLRSNAELPPGLIAAADLRGEGRLDLLGLGAGGIPISVSNTGENPYHWQAIRPQASKGAVTGDNRINSFGIGGEAELRTGTHVVKVPITTPVLHLGLGRRTRSDIVRIQWPNGTSQVEFNVPVDQAVVAEQRLKGSCPFLFSWNGERFEFVSDFMWSTPLGMYINATNPGGFVQTTDWVKVPGNQVRPRDGEYELRVNANLWETHYYDHMALMVVDHPTDTEIFVDERFFMDTANPAWHLTEPPRTIAHAIDHNLQDATAEVRAIDGIHLDRGGRGEYQGVTSEHWVEVDLGDDVPKDGPVWLLARGWVHPTDSSVNYALEQGRHDRPHGVILEIPDDRGGWKTGRDRLGFPAGKNKTMMIRLDGMDGSGVPRRIRLRTNMEIYWDAIQFARGLDDSIPLQQTLLPASAHLHSRGIIAMSQANPSSPELPDYDQVVAHGQAWRDLTGYHTRFGETRDLLNQVDDRYAILTSGDEITLRFVIPAGPPPGWARDFVWISDGWVKDGDFNTRFGNTVLPLPAHDQLSYNRPPGDLEDDPVFLRHSDDWDVFHTRFVSPQVYQKGLRPFRKAQSAGAGGR